MNVNYLMINQLTYQKVQKVEQIYNHMDIIQNVLFH
jgi:hypothetical protein